MCRCTRTSFHQARSSPPERASRPTASSSSWLTSASALKSVPTSPSTSSSRTRAASAGSWIRASALTIRATESSSRSRTPTSSSASRARAPLITTPAGSLQRRRKISAGTSATSVATNAGQTWPPIGDAVVQHLGGEDPGRDPDRREDRREPDVGDGHPVPLAPERRRERGGHHQVRARQDEQRNRVEIDSLVFGAHWASEMIRRPPGGVEEILAGNPLRATWKDGPDGLLESPTARSSVAGTGRCEPRSPVPGLVARGEHMGRARRHHPPSGGLFPIYYPARSALRRPRRAQSENSTTSATPGGVGEPDLGRVAGEEAASGLDDARQRVERSPRRGSSPAAARAARRPARRRARRRPGTASPGRPASSGTASPRRRPRAPRRGSAARASV